MSEQNNVAEIFNIPLKTIEGEETTLAPYKGKVIIFVNIASKCGFTPQYSGLEQLYQLYKEAGLMILGFPCNQFAGQEPGTESEILDFCMTNYGVSFPLFEKIDVNGENEHAIYKILKEAAPGVLGTEAVKWNFTKFIVSIDLKVQRFAPSTTPVNLEPIIKELLGVK